MAKTHIFFTLVLFFVSIITNFDFELESRISNEYNYIYIYLHVVLAERSRHFFSDFTPDESS